MTYPVEYDSLIWAIKPVSMTGYQPNNAFMLWINPSTCVGVKDLATPTPPAPLLYV